MKSILVSVLLLSTLNSFGMALHCTGTAKGPMTITLTAGNFVGDWLKDAKADVTFVEYTGLKVTVSGRSAQLESDEKYKPSKYINHKRFDLSNMTEVTKFGKFYPADQCRISVLIPDNAAVVRTFSAPTIINCDQSGGSTTLSCSLK